MILFAQKAVVFLSVFLMSALAFADDGLTLSKIQNSTTSEAAVTAVMNDQYGQSFNEKFQCWVFSNEQEETYCITPSKPVLVKAKDGERIYFYAIGSLPLNSKGIFSNVTQLSEGLFGGFVLKKTPAGKWVYLAKDKERYYGSVGNCCTVPQLVRLSPKDDYAWLFASGGVWQGAQVSNYSILLPHNGGFVDLSKIPQMKEKEQNNIYQLSVENNKVINGYFPIKLEKRNVKNNKLLSTRLISFDLKTQQYVVK